MSSDAISSSASSIAAESLSPEEESSNFRRLFKLARPHVGALSLATLSLFIGSGIGLLYPQMARFTIDDVIQQGGTAGMDMRTIGLRDGRLEQLNPLSQKFPLMSEFNQPPLASRQ